MVTGFSLLTTTFLTQGMSLVLAKGPLPSATADIKYPYSSSHNNNHLCNTSYRYPGSSLSADIQTDSSSADSFPDSKTQSALTQLQQDHQKNLKDQLRRHEELQGFNIRLVDSASSTSGGYSAFVNSAVNSLARNMPSAFGLYDGVEVNFSALPLDVFQLLSSVPRQSWADKSLQRSCEHIVVGHHKWVVYRAGEPPR